MDWVEPGWGFAIAESTFGRLKKRLPPELRLIAEAPNSPDPHWSLLLAANHVAHGFSAASDDLCWLPEDGEDSWWQLSKL